MNPCGRVGGGTEGFEFATQSVENAYFNHHAEFCAHIYAHTSTECPLHCVNIEPLPPLSG